MEFCVQPLCISIALNPKSWGFSDPVPLGPPRDLTDFASIYAEPAFSSTMQVWSLHLKKDIECLERIQRKATKLLKGLKRKSYEERLKTLKLHSLQQRRLRGDLIETYKILTGKERVDSQLFFSSLQTLTTYVGTRWSSFCQDVRQLLAGLSSAQQSSATGTRCHIMSLKLHLSMRSRTDWTSTGQMWAFKAKAT